MSAALLAVALLVEQDMYPVQFDVPPPIARRTRDYLRGVGIGGKP